MDNITAKSISALRVLAIEGVQAARSGHPGLPLGAAPMCYELFARHMAHNPADPSFFNRDRFVLSAGHGSMLLYSLLHLFGYDVTIDDLKNFRQLGAKTTGHPEYGVCPGVETSTGPLGQGVANAVGMAIAEEWLSARFNKPGYKLVDHYTFALCGEGCLMEGIENEAASLAGTLKLKKLIVLYDCNKITIEGSSDLAFDEDVAKRHAAQGWNVIEVSDGEDIEAVGRAIEAAKAQCEKPTLIKVRTIIGFGSPKAGSSSCHGSPLGDEGVAATKRALGYDAPPFTVPGDVRAHYAAVAERLKTIEEDWNRLREAYAAEYPDEHAEFTRFIAGGLPELKERAELWEFEAKPIATRKAGGVTLNRIAAAVPNFLGGSADLAPSNVTSLNGLGDFSAADRRGRNIHFGIREHAMAAICNGMYLHGGILPFCSTFFSFSDYMKNAIRMSAIMEIPVLYVFTHDSIGVGEDGPTHQPVEQLAGLRAMPGLKVYRPADAVETAACFISAYESPAPSCIVESRQDLPPLLGSGKDALKGGYIVRDCRGTPEVIVIATGSEVSVSLQAAEAMEREGVKIRVVSMPCVEVFEAQCLSYRETVLPVAVKKRVAVEAGSSLSWGKYVGPDGGYVCMDSFGLSSPSDKLFEKFGFTPENICRTVMEVLKR